MPLSVTGSRRSHVLAFARRFEDQEVVVVVPRLTAGLTKDDDRAPLGESWGDTRLALGDARGGGQYRDVFTGETIIGTEMRICR